MYAGHPSRRTPETQPTITEIMPRPEEVLSKYTENLEGRFRRSTSLVRRGRYLNAIGTTTILRDAAVTDLRQHYLISPKTLERPEKTLTRPADGHN